MKKLFRKIITAALTAGMFLSVASPVMADTVASDSTVKAEFKDVNENIFYYMPIYWAKLNGITAGTSATTFSPDQPCTRGQMAAFLWRLKGSQEPSRTDYFQDVPSNSNFAKAIAWAKENGITSGTSSTTYSPDQPCTRGQMAAFLWRLNGSPEPAGTEYFQDVSTDSSFAKAIAWAKESGITSGTSPATYSPDQPCTRGQMAAFLWRQSDSPSVKVLKWVVDTPAWDETVDQAAYDEQVEVQAAYDEPVYEERTVLHCNGCGAVFYTIEDLRAHEDAAVAADSWSACGTCWSRPEQVQTGTIHHDAVYKTVHHDAGTSVVHHDEVGHWE